jgi:hypothetical protein
MTVASLMMYQETGSDTFLVISYALLLLVSALILLLLVRTFSAARHNRICLPPKA